MNSLVFHFGLEIENSVMCSFYCGINKTSKGSGISIAINDPDPEENLLYLNIITKTVKFSPSNMLSFKLKLELLVLSSCL